MISLHLLNVESTKLSSLLFFSSHFIKCGGTNVEGCIIFCRVITRFRPSLGQFRMKQASLRAFVATEHAAFCDFIQERHDELYGMITSQNQYF